MRNKSLFRRVITIAVPVGLQSMLQSSFAMVDQLMVGQMGSAAVAAVEAAGRPAFIFSVAAGAAAAVAGVMISHFLNLVIPAASSKSSLRSSGFPLKTLSRCPMAVRIRLSIYQAVL